MRTAISPSLLTCAALLCACGSPSEEPAAEPSSDGEVRAPAEADRAPEPAPPATLEPAPAPPTEASTVDASAADGLADASAPVVSPKDDPCSASDPVRLTLRERRKTVTPWGLTVRYLGGGHKILMSPGGGRGGDESFWEIAVQLDKRAMQTRLQKNNWRRARNFRGFCWRGVGVPGWHARSVNVEVAPNCSESGELVTKGCKGVFTKR